MKIEELRRGVYDQINHANQALFPIAICIGLLSSFKSEKELFPAITIGLTSSVLALLSGVVAKDVAYGVTDMWIADIQARTDK